MFDLRLIRAEILKLRRRPGLLAVTGVLAFVSVAVYYAVVIALHAGDPANHAAAGGIDGFKDAMGLLSMTAAVAGVLVGATAGGADIEAGVFRDLVATAAPGPLCSPPGFQPPGPCWYPRSWPQLRSRPCSPRPLAAPRRRPLPARSSPAAQLGSWPGCCSPPRASAWPPSPDREAW